jgi:hypothetical protein
MAGHFNRRFGNKVCLDQVHSMTVATQKQKENMTCSNARTKENFNSDETLFSGYDRKLSSDHHNGISLLRSSSKRRSLQQNQWDDHCFLQS